jgi:DNA-binding XRE family transcriptional regulator
VKSTIPDSTIGLGAVLDRNSVMRKDLASGIGVAAETVARWCTGTSTPGGRTVLRIVAFLRRFEPALKAEDIFAKDGRS